MQIPMTPDQIQEAGAKRGLTIKQLCDLAQIHTSSFYRWRAGSMSVDISVYFRLINVLRDHPVIEE